MSPPPGHADFDAVGLVPILGRQPLTDVLLAGRTLRDLAVDLTSRLCGVVEVVDAELAALPDFVGRVAPRGRILIHDPLCPLTPIGFVSDVLGQAGPAVVAVRPVVDTLKSLRGEVVVRTVDRERLRVVASPIAVDAGVLAAVREVADALRDPATLVARLREVADVVLVDAPPAARRVFDVDDVRVLEAAQEVGGRR